MTGAPATEDPPTPATITPAPAALASAAPLAWAPGPVTASAEPEPTPPPVLVFAPPPPDATLPELEPEPASRSTPPPVPDDARKPPPRRRLRLGELLMQAGVVDEAAVDRALGVQTMGGGRLGSIFVKLKLCTDAQIREALARQFDVNVVELAEFAPDPAVLNLLPIELIKKYEAVPLRVEEDTIWVAMMDPYNLTALDDIRFCTGTRKIVAVTCTESDFNKFIQEKLAAQSLVHEILEGGDFYEKAVSSIESGGVPEVEDERPEIVHDLKLAGEQAPIVTLCNFLLVESIKRRASDIHIEAYETYFRVRLRIDGRLHTLLTPPQRLHGPMICRLKVMSEMDIAKRRIPQDGHIAIVYGGETVHYRVSTLPTVYGEKCVIRLLKKDAGLQSLEVIGFSPEELEVVRAALHMPQGIVLVTGPTGSGKTTTVHAGLGEINKTDTNIVTLEDPVEASISGINHVQINDASGLSFSSGLRSILRQDPDVVFVGEMRDPEVSAIAVRAALTGHLVLSTLHTNSAAESLMRLADMGVPPYLLANALIMIIAQRLVRRICAECAKPYQPTPEEAKSFHLTPQILAGAKMRKGAGCDACMNSGYRGRIAVYELLNVTNELRELVRSGAPVEKILAAAQAGGMAMLYDAGVRRALAGETTLDEVQRVLSEAR
ncbi:MAG: Flp pilus assembly complex ATPase component TadA [Deltaproteobacteria bacterium]|nr:Flp pilus assembly complex ATPase component TadA [Deltaproteobacteria bacterium]